MTKRVASEASVISFHDFEARTEMDDFEILEWLENFRSTSVDTERMFSFARLRRNFLQNRLPVIQETCF